MMSIKKLAWLFVTTVAFTPFSLFVADANGQAQNDGTQIVHYSRSAGDKTNKGEMPNFGGTLVAIRVGGHLGNTIQNKLQGLGVNDFVILRPEQSTAHREPANQQPVSGFLGQIVARTIANANGEGGYENGPSANRIIDPCTKPGYVIVCVSVTEPTPVGSFAGNDGVGFSRNSGSSNYSEGGAYQRYDLGVRVDLYDNRGERTIFTPLGAIWNLGYSGNRGSWSSNYDRNFGSWISFNEDIPVNVALASAVRKGVETLFNNNPKHRNGWHVGASNAVRAALRVQPVVQDEGNL